VRLKYRPAAIADIQCTAEYIEKVLKNRSAAQRLKAQILQGASLLKENPQMGTPLSSKYEGLDTSLRFIVISKQLVFYEICNDVVEIIRVLDGRTDYLSCLFDYQTENTMERI